MNNEKPQPTFASVVATTGASRNLLADLQRGKFYFIPDGFYEIINLHEGKTISEIKEYYEFKYDRIIEAYFEFMDKEELYFYSNYTNNFRNLILPGIFQHADF